MKTTVKPILILSILVFSSILSIGILTPQVNSGKSLSGFSTPEQAARAFFAKSSVAGKESADTGPIPVTDYLDYGNGTTKMVIDYQNGTRDVLTETMLLETAKLQLGETTADQSMAVDTPTSTEESTEWISETSVMEFEQEVLMGFTYTLIAKRWNVIDLDIVVAYCKVDIVVDVQFGLRLPLEVTLEYPEQMTVKHNYPFYATLKPINKPGFNEFICTLIAGVEVSAGILVWPLPPVWVEYSDFFGPNYDFSKSFTTPLGSGMSFPISEIEVPIVDFWPVVKVSAVIEPQLGSDKITSHADAGGDAQVDKTLTWSEANQKKEFTVKADDYDPAPDHDYASIFLSDFRYYFSIFKLHFKLKFDFYDWIEWLTGGPYYINIYTLNMDWLTEGLYLKAHAGTEPTVNIPDIFVKKFGVNLIITPSSRNIVPGEVGTYNVHISNIGNVEDTFTLSLMDLPGTWWYEFESTEVTLSKGGSADKTLSINPYKHWSTSPGDYPFDVEAESQQALLHDLEATDTKGAKVHVLPFYEVDIMLLPSSDSTTPGGTGSYLIAVKNLGNVPDSFSLSLTYFDFDGAYRVTPTIIPSEWVTMLPTMLTLNPGNTGYIAIWIEVPSDWAGMENAPYEFQATATSSTDVSATDSELGEFVVEATKESKARYINIELQELIDSVSASPFIPNGVRNSLLSQLTNAMKKKDQTLEYIIEGRYSVANNMLGASANIMGAFINHVEAQSGKHIPSGLAGSWISTALTIIADLNDAYETMG